MLLFIFQGIVGDDACIPVSEQENRQEYPFGLFHIDLQSLLHCRKNGDKLLGVDQVQQSASAKKIRLKKEGKKVGLWEGKGGVVHPDPK